MRTSHRLLATLISLSALAACTVSDVDTPDLTGPSTFAYSIDMQSNTNTLVRDGVSQARITITGRDHNGQPVTGRPLRAGIYIDGVEQDYGMLSTKNPVTGSTITYTAPNGNPLATTAQTVTIGVTPLDSGVYRGEFPRSIDIELVPMGVIQPSNPNLVAAFTFSPTSAKAMDTVSFTAATTTNAGAACGTQCSYSWTFGDNTSGSGMVTTHQFRTTGAYQVTLTVTDARGAQSTAVQLVNVAPGTPPTANFTYSPQPTYTMQDIILNAETSAPAPGRTIVNYGWNFGDGRVASGYTVAIRYETAGSYTVTLRVTDDAGATATFSQVITVTNPQPAPQFTMTPQSPVAGALVDFNASTTTGPAPIATYSWNFGNGLTATGVTAQTTYALAGQYTVTLTVTDTAGRVASVSRNVTVQ